MEMKTLHKHAIQMDHTPTLLELPKGAVIRRVEYVTQEKGIFMWVEIPIKVNLEKNLRKFKIFKTGDAVPNTHIYVGTAIDAFAPEAYHLYESIE